MLFTTVVFYLAILNVILLVHGKRNSIEIPEISVPLKFGSSELALTFPATEKAAEHMANKFCIEKGITEGEEYDSCYKSVSQYLTDSVQKFNKKNKRTNHKLNKHIPQNTTPKENEIEVLTITLKISDVAYNIDFKYETQTANTAAIDFTMSNCINPIEAQLDQAVTEHRRKAASSAAPHKKQEAPESKHKSEATAQATATTKKKAATKPTKNPKGSKPAEVLSVSHCIAIVTFFFRLTYITL